MGILESKTVVIVGAAGLLGKEFTRTIYGGGATVVLLDRDLDQLREMVSELELESDRIFIKRIDITDEPNVHAIAKDLGDGFSTIHGLVNSAYPRNKRYGRHLCDVSYDDFVENVSWHLGGYFNVMKGFSGLFQAQKKGAIVNVSSIYGSAAPRFDIYDGTQMTMPVEYAAIKSGINHLTRYFAQFYKSSGVRYNTISPGGVLNGQPIEFVSAYNKHCGQIGMLQPTHLSSAALFLLSDMSEAVTGQDIVVDDGFTL